MRVLLQKVAKTSLHSGQPLIPYLHIPPMNCPHHKRENKEPMALTDSRQWSQQPDHYGPGTPEDPRQKRDAADMEESTASFSLQQVPLMNSRTSTYTSEVFPRQGLTRLAGSAINNYSGSGAFDSVLFTPWHDFATPYQVTVRRKSSFFQGKRQPNTNPRLPNIGATLFQMERRPFSRSSGIQSKASMSQPKRAPHPRRYAQQLTTRLNNQVQTLHRRHKPLHRKPHARPP